MNPGIVDWHVSYGFSPRQRVDASRERVEKLLAAHGVGTALMHHLEGLWYDPLSGNEALLTAFAGTPHVPVCTVNPLEGEERCRRAFAEARDRGARFWRLYPKEQGWDMGHPVAALILDLLREGRCCLLMDSDAKGIQAALDLARDEVPVVGSLHFYDSADWSLRLRPYRSFYPTTRLLHGPGTLRETARIFGDRLLFASGAPFGAVASSLALLDEVGEAVRERTLRGNARELLGRFGHGD